MSIGRNASFNFLGYFVPSAVMLVTVPLYLHVIGIERYGVLSLFWLFLGYLGLLDLGLGRAVVHQMARLGRASPAERNALFWTALWVSLGLALFGIALIVPTLLLVLPQFQSSSPLAAEFRAAAPWLAAIVPIVLVTSILSGSIEGRERFGMLNIVNAAGIALLALLPLAAAYLQGPQLAHLLAAALTGRALWSLLMWLACLRIVPLGRPVTPKRSLLGTLLTFGGWVTAANIIALLLASFERFAIAGAIGVAAVGIYVLAYSIAAPLGSVAQALGTALFPRFSAAEADDVQVLQLQGVGALLAIMTPLVIAMIAVAEPFLWLWVGPKLTVRAAPLAAILGASFWLNAIARMPHSRLMGEGLPRKTTIILLLELGPYLAVLFSAIALFGLIGAAIAWLFRSLLDLFLLLRQTGNLKITALQMWRPTALVAAALALSAFLPMSSLLRWAGLAFVMFAALLWSIYEAPQVLRGAFDQLLSRIGLRLPWARFDRGLGHGPRLIFRNKA